jgi:hypothetical protein
MKMSDDEVLGLIAKSLWQHFQFELPDTPVRVAKALLVILDVNGYAITKQ